MFHCYFFWLALYLNLLAVHDSDKPGKLSGVWTEAMPYFRRGSLAEHIHECLRNHCLAIENVVSQICARDSVTGSERCKMRHVLRIVYSDYPARRNLELVWRGSDTASIDALVDYVYKQVRCQLAHARKGELKVLPYGEQDQQTMKEAKDVVELVARDMIAYQLASLP